MIYISNLVSRRCRTSFVTVHAYVTSNGICRGFAFKYGKFLLPPRFLTALSVPKVPTRVQYRRFIPIRRHLFQPLIRHLYAHSTCKCPV